MLTIRLQRLGRKGYPVYRFVVQEAQVHPTSGRIVEHVGSYNPHTKETNLDIEKVQKFLDNGAQPSERVTKILSLNKEIKLPKWVKAPRSTQNKAIKNATKLRKNQPKEAESTEA